LVGLTVNDGTLEELRAKVAGLVAEVRAVRDPR